MESRREKFLLLLGSLLLATGVLVGLDRLLPVIVPALKQPQQGLIFSPNITLSAHTTEFVALAKINSLGFRDRAFSIPREPGVYRALAIGDSFNVWLGSRH
jgi:hypothetical protein